MSSYYCIFFIYPFFNYHICNIHKLKVILMQALLRSFIQKHTPPVISILLSICAATYYIGQVVGDGFTTMKTELITEAREPTYAILYSQLDKQSEKLDSDPGDIKNADIKLLYNQCNDDFGKVFLETLPPNEMLSAKRNCSMLESLYLDRRTY